MANPFQYATGLVTGSGSSRSYNVSASTAAGDTLTVIVTVNNTTCSVSACTDSQGNVYTLDRSFTTTLPTMYMFRSPGATGGSGGGATAALSSGTPDTVTLTTAASTGSVVLDGTDVPGVGSLDQVVTIATGTSAAPSVSVTPANNNEILVGALVDANASGTPTISSPFTGLASATGASSPFATAGYDLLSGGSGVSQTFSATITSGAWRASIWAFNPGNVSGTATLSGSGTLSAAPTLRGTASLSGSGTFTAVPVLAVVTSMSGSGTLAASPGPVATLSGFGILTVSPVIYVPPGPAPLFVPPLPVLQNILWGTGLLLTAPKGTPVPADAQLGQASAWLALGWVYVGATDSGVSLSWNPTANDVPVETRLTPVGYVVPTGSVQITTTMAEETLAHISLAWGNMGSITSVIPGAGILGKSVLQLSDTPQPLAAAIIGRNQFGYARVLSIPSASSAGQVGTSFRRAAGARLYPLTITATCPLASVTWTDLTAPATG